MCYAPRNGSVASGLLALLLFIVAIIYISKSFEQAPATATELRASDPNRMTATETEDTEPPKPTQTRPTHEEIEEARRRQAEVKKQPERLRFIRKLQKEGIFRKVEFSNQFPYTAEVWVDFQFYSLDYDAKKSLVEVVYAYLITEADDSNVFVTLRDARTNKKVGSYDLFGFRVDR